MKMQRAKNTQGSPERNKAGGCASMLLVTGAYKAALSNQNRVVLSQEQTNGQGNKIESPGTDLLHSSPEL